MGKFRKVVAFTYRDMPTIRQIQRRFRMEYKITVNYECPVDLDDDAEIELLRETERRGYIQIRDKWFEFPKVVTK